MNLPIKNSYQKKLEDKIVKNFENFKNKEIDLNSLEIFKFFDNLISFASGY